ncbi:MAG: hypothetical protein HQM10_22825 [Candidatus Riflebacteria bacterium]|nr:hypothetical protein [Candidatus Riflebacteria bacterium]
MDILITGNWCGNLGTFEPGTETAPTSLWNLPRFIKTAVKHGGESLLFSTGNHSSKLDPVGYASKGYLEGLLKKEIEAVKPFSAMALGPHDTFEGFDKYRIPDKELQKLIWTNHISPGKLAGFAPFWKTKTKGGFKIGFGSLIAEEELAETFFSESYYQAEDAGRAIRRTIKENPELDIIFFVFHGKYKHACEISKYLRINDRIIFSGDEERNGNNLIINLSRNNHTLVKVCITKNYDDSIVFETKTIPLGTNIPRIVPESFKKYALRIDRRRKKTLKDLSKQSYGTIFPARINNHFQAELTRKLFSADISVINPGVSEFISSGAITRETVYNNFPPLYLRCFRIKGNALFAFIDAITSYYLTKSNKPDSLPETNESDESKNSEKSVGIGGAEIEMFAGSLKKLMINRQSLDKNLNYYLVTDETVYNNKLFFRFLKHHQKPAGLTLWDAWEKILDD